MALGGLAALSAIAVDISLPATSLIGGDLDADSNRVQLIVSLYLAGFAFGQIPAGVAADHFGRRHTIMAGLTGFILAGGVCAMADSFNMLLAGRIMQGFCAAVGPVVSRAIVRDIAQGERAAHLMSVLITILTLAPLIAPSAGSLVLMVSDWRAIFWLTAVIGAFVFIAGVIAIRPRPAEIARKDGVSQQFLAAGKRFFSTRQCLFGLALMTLPAGAYLAFLTASPVIMAELYHVSAEAFGPMFSASAIALLIGATISRIYVRILGMVTIIRLGAISLLLSAALFVLLLLSGNMTMFLFWLCASFYMLGFGMIGPSAAAIALDPVPDLAGRAAAFLGTVQLFTGMLFSVLAAFLYDGTVNIIVALFVVSAVSTTWIAFSYRRG